MSDQHENWMIMRRTLGETEARKRLVQALRDAADQIERGGFPDVYGCEVPNEGLTGVESETGWPEIMGRTSVTLSHPWGG